MSDLIRVTKKTPCPICKKDSWCLIGTDSVLCMRATSSKPYTLVSGEQGYWHKLTDAPVKYHPIPKPEKKSLNSDAIIEAWSKRTSSDWIRNLASQLNVSSRSLESLSVAWSDEHQAWAFPMRDGFGRTVGIRLRSENGKKWSVTGSHQGIFMPHYIDLNQDREILFVIEGPTDTAAMITMGLMPAGRPSCSGGSFEIKQLVERIKCRRVVIIADSDRDQKTKTGVKFNPGWDGAQSLMRQLPVKSCIIFLPCKDARQFLEFGGTADGIYDQIKNIKWSNVNH